MACCSSECILTFLYIGDNTHSSLSETVRKRYTYIYTLFLTMTDTMTYKNMDFYSWETCINIITHIQRYYINFQVKGLLKILTSRIFSLCNNIPLFLVPWENSFVSGSLTTSSRTLTLLPLRTSTGNCTEFVTRSISSTFLIHPETTHFPPCEDCLSWRVSWNSILNSHENRELH